MKKYLVIFITALALAVPHKTYAGPAAEAVVIAVAEAAEAAVTELIYKQQKYVDSPKHLNKWVQYKEKADTFYKQLKKEEAAYEHFINQLKKFGNIKNYKDFMKWADRSLYLAERVERDFPDINVKVGNKRYYPQEAMEIKERLENGDEDIWSGDMTEGERIAAYRKSGLPPSNYRYQKTWEGRIDAAVKEAAVSKELINEENGRMEREHESDMKLVENGEELTETQRWQLEMRARDRIVKQRMLFNEHLARKNDLTAAEIKKKETEELPQKMRAGSGYRRVNNNFDL
jgi:hypothetical protein